MIIKIFIAIFVLFVISRLILRFKDSQVNSKEFIVWLILWLVILIVTFLPWTTEIVAKLFGVGRGVDAVIYISIIIIFYSIFRIGIKLEHIENEITKIVRHEALKKDRNQ